MAKQPGRRFELRAERGMRPCRAMPDRNDEILPDENGGFAIGNVIVLKMSGACHDEQLVAINIDLRYLVRLERVFDCQRMKPIILLELLELFFRRFE